MESCMTNYELNPFYIRHLLSNRGFNAIDRLVYREVMDCCWISDGQDRMAYEPKELSAFIGISEDELESAIEKLSESDCNLLKFYVDLESDVPESMISVPYLTDYLEKSKKNEIQEKSESFACEADRNNTISIVDRIKQRDTNFEPSILFLERSERALCDSFSGWIPTKNFDRNGEAYNVREHVFIALKKEFGFDPNIVFKEMFGWLIKNPKKRPGIKSVNEFIHRWFSNYETKNAKYVKQTPIDSIDSKALDILSDI